MKRLLAITSLLLHAIYAISANIEIYPVTFNVPYLSSTMNQVQLVSSDQGISFICGYNATSSSTTTLKDQLNSALQQAGISFARIASVSGYWQGGNTTITIFLDPLPSDTDVRILRISTASVIFDISMVKDDDGILNTYILNGTWSDTGMNDFSILLSGSQYGVTYRLFHDGLPVCTKIGTGESLDFGLLTGVENHGEYTVTASYMNWSPQTFGPVLMQNRYGLSDKNYIVKHTYTSEEGKSWYTDIMYYDDLGNPEQEISINGASGNQNLVRPICYDSMMRSDSVSFLPFAINNSTGGFVTNAISQLLNYYTDECPYSNTYYDSMGRFSSHEIPGSSNRTHGRKQSSSYRINDSSETIQKLAFSYPTTTSDASVALSGYYGENELIITESISEDNDTTIVFKDVFGKKIMSRNINKGINHDTFFVYDMRDSLVCVISPKGVENLPQLFYFNDAFGKEFCYTYRYDSRGNLIEKSIPSKGREYMYYDSRGRLVLYSNIELQSLNKYKYYIHDNLDRLCEEGYGSSNVGVSSLREYFAEGNMVNDIITDKLITKTVTFYDSDDNIPSGFSGTSYAHKNHISYQNCKTLPATEVLYETPTLSGSSIGRMYDTPLLTRHLFYDKYGNLGHIADRGADTWDGHQTYTYNFSGNIIENIEEHGWSGGNFDYMKKVYTYNRRGQKVRIERTVNNINLKPIQYFYDDLGRLVYKTIGDIASEEYEYNIQGWQTSRLATFLGDEVFSQAMRYQEPNKNSSVGRYGGYISELSYRQLGQVENTLSFKYDKLGRIIDTDRFIGDSEEKNNSWIDKNITYDRNGNMLSCTHYTSGNSLAITNTFSANKLMRTSRGTNTYLYDYYPNGNLKTDRSKDLFFYHNLINLPILVKTTSGQSKQRYTYLADGTKLRTRDNWQIGFNYRGNFVYELLSDGTEKLDNIGHEEGNIVGTIKDFSSPNSQFFDTWHVKDHLGNVRAIIDISGNKSDIWSALIEQNDYTPFGQRITNAEMAYDPTNRYRLNGKEDQTIGSLMLYDYGARYYDLNSARWITPDPLAEKYYSISPYVFCNNNPLNYIDQDGMDIRLLGKNGSSVTIFTDLFNQVIDLSPFGVDWQGNYTFKGQEALQYGLDLLGFFTAYADAINTSIYFTNNDWKNAAISAISIVPLVGDLTKVKRAGMAVEYFFNGVKLKKHKHHIIPMAVFKENTNLSKYMHKDKGNLIELPEKFHGNHPAYSKWIKEQIDMATSRGTLSVETINDIKELAKKEINKAEQVWYESNGSINMNTYFKTQHGNGLKQQ